MPNIELRECPFCGSEAELYQYNDKRNGIVSSSVRCKKCRVLMMCIDDKAAEAWNRRKNDAEAKP